MTTIRMNWEDMTLVASGHAGMADRGQDIVCAGISTLVYALLNQLIDAEERGRTELDWAINEESGDLRIQVNPKSGQETRIRAYFRVIMTGFRTLQQYYPENISVGEVLTHGNL